MNERNSIKDKTSQIWGKYCTEIETRFSTTPRVSTLSIIVSDMPIKEPTQVWAMQAVNGSMTISSDADTDSPLLQAIIAREALAANLPLCLNEVPRARDLACHFGRQHLDDPTTVQLWEQLWAVESPSTPMPGGFIYNPIMRLEDLDRLNAFNGFNELMTRLYRIDRYKVIMTFEEYARYLHLFITEYTVPLSATEARVIELVLREPSLTRADIARRLGKSTTWVSTIIPTLLNRGILTQYERVSLPSVGVRTFNLVLMSNDQKLCRDVISEYPFLYSCSPIIAGDTGFIATVCIPDNPTNMDSLVELERACKRLDITMKSFETVQKGTFSFLSTYDPQLGQWDIDWNALQLEARQLATNEDLLGAYPLPINIEMQNPQIDDLGARMLAAFEIGHNTVRELRTAVKARQKRVAELLSKFKRSGVILKIWEVHHVGLNELVVVASQDPLTSKAVSAIAARLPKSYLHFNEGNLFMKTFLPRGGAIGFARALNQLPQVPWILLTEKPTYGQWSLAKVISLWNPRSQRWRPSLEALSKWYERISAL